MVGTSEQPFSSALTNTLPAQGREVLARPAAPEEAQKSPLWREGELLARYLLGRPTVPDVLVRYVQACERIFGRAQPSADLPLLRFVERHPWSLPYLDAVAGLLYRKGQFREKTLLMLALLETTPEHVEFFTPRTTSRLWLMLRLGWWGTRVVGKLLLGLLLYPLAKRAR